MRVTLTQWIDGAQNDPPRTVEPIIEGEGSSDVLDRKAEGAANDGWDVVWRDDGLAFTATKRYEGTSYSEKVRLFELVER